MATNQPLASRMRPTALNAIIGQEHLLYPGSPLHSLTQIGTSVSVILWGPPGTGKTTMAKAIAEETQQEFVELSATSAGVKDVRTVIDTATKKLEADGTRTVLFLDEIHRFSKAQQDILLPAVEAGIVSLIGATTENPSFSVNSALNSRSILLILNALSDSALREIVEQAVDHPDGLGGSVVFDDQSLTAIARSASGDARQALTLLEAVANSAKAAGLSSVDADFVDKVAPAAIARYDKDGDQHYDIISAFIKSMRGSDPDGAVYWLARMIDAGEDPRFIARRLMVHASEDVGLADSSVLQTCVAAAQAVQLIGMPEARLILSHATIAIATAPKSSAAHDAINDALALVKKGNNFQVPKHLRDSHYPGAKALGHGVGYKYPHHYPGAAIKQQYLPDALQGTTFYHPKPHGSEQVVIKRQSINTQLGELNASE